MPKSTVSASAPVPRGVVLSTESSAVLAKRVNALGKCTTATVSETDDQWFPTTRIKDKLVAEAREACGGCPVIAECLELALRAEDRPGVEIHGIFGGRAPHERRALILGRRPAGEVRP